MSDIAIRVENLSKQYKIGAAKYRHDSIRDHLTEWVKSLFTRNGTPSPSTLVSEPSALGPQPSALSSQPLNIIWALKDVSFEVKHGEVVGIIGRNGSGKSTLLKILSRITEPTSGFAEIHGRVGSLLEVGTGFHRDLTGRENIYLNGAILGMKKAEIARKFDEIVDFSGVEKFIDTPVKRYSSGMNVRLAFAVAAHLDPEILILDEVLAVGDAAFQKKCLGKMEEATKGGRTILLVSHNMAAITHVCESAILLSGGRMLVHANAEEAVTKYLEGSVEHIGQVTFPDDAEKAPGSQYIRLLGVRLRNPDGKTTSSLEDRTPFVLEIKYRILKPVSGLRIGLTLMAYDGLVIFTSLDANIAGEEKYRAPGKFQEICEIPAYLLKPGRYYVTLGCDVHLITAHFLLERVLSFRIIQTDGYARDSKTPLLRLELPWQIQKLD